MGHRESDPCSLECRPTYIQTLRQEHSFGLKCIEIKFHFFTDIFSDANYTGVLWKLPSLQHFSESEVICLLIVCLPH